MDKALRPHLSGPLYRRVFETLRLDIVEGLWKAGERLPASRELAKRLAVSRNTVNTAYDMLQAEGYIVAKPGSGYFVAASLPDLTPLSSHQQPFETDCAEGALSARGRILASHTRPVAAIDNPAFQPGLPDMEDFPFKHWQQCLRAHANPPAALTGYQEQGGHADLKAALSDYLQLSRGLRCTAGQIVLVNGSQAGLDLLARMLVNPGDTIALEEPGYLGARDAFRAAGAELAPVPVDENGLVADALPATAKLVYCTPSYQFPLGSTMSAARRMQLLNWAAAHSAYVVEDDYDSEFRYGGRPLSALQGLDQQHRVIYLGTFSKVMFPGLRLGYLALPPRLAKAFALALRKTGQDPPLIWQAAMADFIREGYFASHLRKMRKRYGEKQRLLVQLLQQHLSRWLEVTPTAAGMQLAGYYRQEVNEEALLAEARRQNIVLAPLSRYYLGPCPQPGLYLGYAGVAPAAMADNVRRLQVCFEAQA